MMGFLRRLIDERAYRTMFGEARCFTTFDSHGSRVRVLSIDGTYQSATYLDERWNVPPFAYILAFDCMREAETAGLAIEDVLMLGGGCFSYPKRFLTRGGSARMDVVEIDPAIVRIARERFYLDRLEERLACAGESERLGIFVQDGLDYLETTERRYDVVINDCFEGARASEGLGSPRAMAAAKRCLRGGGLLMTNVVVDLTTEGAARLLVLVRTLESAFEHVHIIEASDPEFGGADNYIVIGTDGAYSFSNTVGFG